MTIYQMIDDYYIKKPKCMIESVRTFLDDNRDWGGVVNFCYYDSNIYCGWSTLGMKIPHGELISNFKLPEDKAYKLQFYVNHRINDSQVGLRGLYNSDVASSWQEKSPLSNQALEIIQEFVEKIEREWNYNIMTSRKSNNFKAFCDKKDCKHYNNYGHGCMDNYIKITDSGCLNYAPVQP